MLDLSRTLINVIDIWDTDQISFDNLSKESIELIKQDMCEFSKFLSIKLDSYKKQGAHINIAMHHHSPNPFFTFLTDNKNDLNFMEDPKLLKKYMDDNQLTQLIICGAHLFKCISDRPTGYIKMKTIVPNTKIAITLCRALPQDVFSSSPYPTIDLVYL
jgi:hypothetical protein